MNRIAFDLGNIAATERVEVLCLFGGALAYRCRGQIEHRATPATALRVTVEIPDLDRGPDVVVRFTTATGKVEAGVRIVNRPRVFHEIESVPLRNGGVTVTDGNGRLSASPNLARERAITAPAAVWPPAGQSACGRTYARWVSANATDPVFTSSFGALNGAVVLARAPQPGSSVDAANSPEWLITYPQGATRVQFIAHYELEFRVAVCSELAKPL